MSPRPQNSYQQQNAAADQQLRERLAAHEEILRIQRAARQHALDNLDSSFLSPSERQRRATIFGSTTPPTQASTICLVITEPVGDRCLGGLHC